MLGHAAADPPRDPLGTQRHLLDRAGRTLAPLTSAVGIADRHPHDRDREMHASERRDPRDTPPCANDHRTTDLLAQDAIRRAHVIGALRRDRRGLQAKPGVAYRSRGVLDHRVTRLAAVLQGQVEALDLKLQGKYVGAEHPQGLLQQLLPGLISVEHDDLQRVTHSSIPRSARCLIRGVARLAPESPTPLILLAGHVRCRAL